MRNAKPAFGRIGTVTLQPLGHGVAWLFLRTDDGRRKSGPAHLVPPKSNDVCPCCLKPIEEKAQ